MPSSKQLGCRLEPGCLRCNQYKSIKISQHYFTLENQSACSVLWSCFMWLDYHPLDVLQFQGGNGNHLKETYIRNISYYFICTIFF